jgi:hypothetical protein
MRAGSVLEVLAVIEDEGGSFVAVGGAPAVDQFVFQRAPNASKVALP